MTQESRVRRWLRRRPREIPEPEPGPSDADRYFVPPPAVEALPAYSPAADTELPPTLTSLSTPSEPPPDYNQTPEISQQKDTPKVQFTLSQQYQHLDKIFSIHPWRRHWGPRPACFADALNKGALLGIQPLLTALFDLGVEVRGNVTHATQTTTPMHEALRGPKPWFALAFIGRLQDAGGDARELLDSHDALGCTPLHIAAEAGETAIARTFVLFHGADVDAVDNIGRTPLHMAARYGRTETVAMLLDYGADPAQVDEKLWSGAEGHEKLKELLGSYGLISDLLGRVLSRQTGIPPEPPDEVSGEGIVDEETEPGTTLSNKDMQDENNPAYTFTRPPLVTSGALSAQPSLQCSIPNDPPPLLRVNRGSLHDTHASDEMATRIVAAYGSDDIQMALRLMRNRGAFSSRRPVHTMIYTQEYMIWRSGCEILQEESRAQRERNRREGGNGLDSVYC